MAESIAANAEWMSRARQALIRSRYTTEVVLASGRGATVADVEGKEYLDFESGQVCMSLGHGHPDIAEAMIRQIGKLMQTGSNFTTTEEIELAESLRHHAPQEDARVYLASTGSESNEAAMRLAKKATGRYEIVGVVGAYHGQTHGSWSLTTHIAGPLAGYGPQMAGVSHVPTPYCYRCPLKLSYPACDIACADMAEDVIDRQTSGKPAAFIYEVVMSAGGIVVPPVEWFHRMRDICDRRGMVLIADEAQTGMGRTGTWFACEQTGVIPEIMTLSKSLGGGVPLAGVIAKGSVAEAASANGYSQSSSHCGDPFTAAVGIANIRVIERDDLLERSAEVGRQVRQRLDALQEEAHIIGDVRGLGSIWGMEIVRDSRTKEPWPEGAASIFDQAREAGLILSLRPTARDRRNVIRIVPPIVISDDELHRGLDILAEVAKAVDHHRSH